jgi:hypothetical protein
MTRDEITQQVQAGRLKGRSNAVSVVVGAGGVEVGAITWI